MPVYKQLPVPILNTNIHEYNFDKFVEDYIIEMQLRCGLLYLQHMLKPKGIIIEACVFRSFILHTASCFQFYSTKTLNCQKDMKTEMFRKNELTFGKNQSARSKI